MRGKSWYPIFFSVLICLSNNITAQINSDWQMVWNDEFNYAGLPDSSKWGYEVGHVRNNELQYYTRARKENIRVENGMLVITGRKEPIANANYKPGSIRWQTKDSLAGYTSASINTDGKASWLYGRMEMRAQLPMGGGIWPAFWMMGVNRKDVGWPFCGETDIMEFVGNHPSDMYGTIHYPDPVSKQPRSKSGKLTDASPGNSFHLYSIEWDTEKIEIYFDDRKYNTFYLDSAGKGTNNTFRKPFYLLINLAMGAAWPGPIDNGVLPQEYVIDYVRVYQRRKAGK